MIAYCHSCGMAMDVSAVAPFSNVECPTCGKHTRVKREFGPYTLTRRLAVGGMSMVFVAQDNTLDREVALKILSETYSSDGKRIAAFEEEARLTASLGHPNIVRVYTTGKAFGRFYIAMELVPGGHFEHRIHERGSIPEEELLPVAMDVAEGLKAAHAAGLIHRDVKPGNILLDSEDHAKLVDFGLALVTHGGSATATELWATPYYVPPETIEGEPEDLRSDIYAFGATLYHALTGKPSCAEETMATDLLRAAKRKVVRLSSLAHPSSEEIRALIDKAMAHDPADRYQDYDTLLADLRAAQAQLRGGATLRMRRAAERRELKNRKSRNRIFAVTAALAALATFAVLAIVVLRQKNEPLPAVTTPGEVNAPAAVPDDSAELAKLYRSAREALEAHDYPAAAGKFKDLFHNPEIKEPTRSWAGVEAVLACYLDAKPRDARQSAKEVLEHLRDPRKNPGLGEAVGNLLEALHSPAPMHPPDATDGTVLVIGSMLAGLKNWEQGMIDRAAECFDEAAGVKLPHQSAWAEIYQKIAHEYQHDADLLSSAVFDGLPESTAGCDKALAELADLAGKLKTGGRAKFNARAWEIDIRRQRKMLAMVPSAPPENKPPAAPADPMPRAREAMLGFRFKEAADVLRASKDPKAGGYAFLAESSAAFLSDLEKGLASAAATPPLRLRSGETVTRLVAAAPGKLVATLADGTTRACGWKDLPPETFVDLHRALVAAAPDAEKPARHERAIAFDWLVGDRTRATEAAAKLAAAYPAFKTRWDAAVTPLAGK